MVQQQGQGRAGSSSRASRPRRSVPKRRVGCPIDERGNPATRSSDHAAQDSIGIERRQSDQRRRWRFRRCRRRRRRRPQRWRL